MVVSQILVDKCRITKLNSHGMYRHGIGKFEISRMDSNSPWVVRVDTNHARPCFSILIDPSCNM